MASAAGLMNFSRTLAGAFATSMVTTNWESRARMYRSELVGSVDSSTEIAPALLEYLVEAQSFTLSNNRMFMVSAMFIFCAAMFVWFIPKQKRAVDTTAIH